VYTGDVKSAGTDSAISLTLFGSEGTTPEFELDKDESRFERGGVDLIRMDLDDVGKLLKARIAVDGKGTRPDWFLEKVFYFILLFSSPRIEFFFIFVTSQSDLYLHRCRVMFDFPISVLLY